MFVSLAITVPLINTISTEYHSGRTVDNDKKKILNCKPRHTDATSGQNVSAELFDKEICRKRFC